MKTLVLLLIIGLKAIVCKGLVAAVLLLLFWLKDRQLNYSPDKWDSFFLSLPPQTVQRYIIGAYLFAAAVSSAIACFALTAGGYEHSLLIAVMLFAAGMMISGWRYCSRGKACILRSCQEISKRILEERKNGELDEHE